MAKLDTAAAFGGEHPTQKGPYEPAVNLMQLFIALIRKAASEPCPAHKTYANKLKPLEIRLLVFLATLNSGARRDIRLYARGVEALSTDEKALINLIAAIQNGRQKEAQMRAQWLTRYGHGERLVYAASALADSLADQGIYLPQAEIQATAVAGTPPILSLARSRRGVPNKSGGARAIQ